MAGDGKQHVVVVGGGLVGALNACFFAKKGYRVDVYEMRDDIRKAEAVKGRSINLALSTRGREALKAVGAEDIVMKSGIEMYARMIHNPDGTTKPIPYGTPDQYIMSVDRRLLNELLLNVAERNPGVNLHFEHKLINLDTNTGETSFKKADGELVNTPSDLLVGCDGAYSAVRREVMKKINFDYSQEYIPHAYMELRMPPKKDGGFIMPKNYLHIWPRNTFMMIALPNGEDNSFVCTLFMPIPMFETIKTRGDLLNFFDDKFPDSLDLLGRDELVETFFRLKPLSLVSVKCNPYHVRDRLVMMGDAIHAMVPFYGQGMNCGFEDCLVFSELMDKYNNEFGKVLPAFTEVRGPDAKAICDLAMYNYIEMRASVNSKMFLLRKKLDNFLYMLMPKTWIPLYTMVSFTRTRYHQCIARRKWQDEVLQKLLTFSGVIGVAAGVGCAAYLMQNNDLQLLHKVKDALMDLPYVANFLNKS